MDFIHNHDLNGDQAGTSDYIVIGAGSAGCVVANRLSANPKNTVTLLEAGNRDWNPWIHIPVGYFKTMGNPKFDWCYKTEPDPGLNGRSIDWPRGKVLGGSSSLNGLLYVRGQPQDYDNWLDLGNPGWGWKDILPLFKKSEDQERGADDYHGIGGPLSVSNMRLQRPIVDAWVQAAINAGYTPNPDYNGANQEGVGYYQLTTNGGKRCSSAAAFLTPAQKRPNLNIITKAFTQRLLFKGHRAAGAIYKDKRGKLKTLKANKEIILCAGTIGSAQLLMLSGIGEGSHLKDHNIDVLVNLPGVGKNLQDHLQARLIFKCNEPTLNDEINSLFKKARIATKYAMFRAGPMTMAASLGAAFLKTDKRLKQPDIQFHIQPWSADSPSEGVHPFSAFTASICQLRPESRGEIKLKSANPIDYPKIHPNYLSEQIDRETLVKGIKVGLNISEKAPLLNKISQRCRPGKSDETDEQLLEWAKQTSTTIYHPTGTCKMGNDSQSVVDHRLRVRGVAGLRVADCSIMPQIVSGNTNAPAIMIGEKVSEMILSDAPYVPMTVETIEP